MHADATQLFTFRTTHRATSAFTCLARTRAEAEQIARHAAAPVRLIESRKLGPREGDTAARQGLRADPLLGDAFRGDADRLVEVLQHVRFTPGDTASIVPVAFLPPSVAAERGLRVCQGEHPGGIVLCAEHAAGPKHVVPVEPPLGVDVAMSRDGSWLLRLQLLDGGALKPAGVAGSAKLLGWRLPAGVPFGDVDPAKLLPPATSVWEVAREVLVSLVLLADMRGGESSSLPACSRHVH